ncbi:YqjF family protein [Nocardioides salsibiostraticola]
MRRLINSPQGGPPLSSADPTPRGPTLMNQDWRDLTWLHWAVEPERVAGLLPRGVRPDVLDGVTYVGLVPFRMVDAGFGSRQSVPWFGSFLETNVRLYSVDADGRRGVVFLSLDANRLPVVLGARATLNLPYRWAEMDYHRRPGGIDDSPTGDIHDYTCRLRLPSTQASSRIRIRVGAERELSAVDHFVADRFRLHTRRLGRLLEVPNHHGPWPAYDAEVLELDDDLVASVGLPELSHRAPDLVAFSPGVHTTFGLPSLAAEVPGS